MDFSKLNLEDNQVLARKIMLEAYKKKPKTRKEFEKIRNAIIKDAKGVIFHNLYFIKAYRDLVSEGKIKEEPALMNLIQKRSVRTMSGVAPVTVLTKPYPCPGRCVYCPTDVRMPKSYIATQPAAQRAYRQNFDPYTQVNVRLRALHTTGHEVSKVDLRIIGGTWSSYPKNYQNWFLKRCIQAMNDFHGKTSKNPSLEKVIKENEKAKVRCIGINVETRPDFINEKEVRRLRELNVTKVEMGVQTTDDEILKIVNRGHDLAAVKKATKLLKDAGFKVSYHMMPNLPGATISSDKKMIEELFKNSDYQPDYLKIYPCVVISGTVLSKWYREGKYKPYTDKALQEVLLAEMKSVPEWCRVDRIARDIPANEIEAGFKISNIRQMLDEQMKKAKISCRDIRAREIQYESINPKNVKLIIRKYEASDGRELFLSFEDIKKDKIIALLRLRFPSKTFLPELKDAALIREIHVYGRQIAVGKHSKGKKQHFGWGRRLMDEAEKLSKEAKYKKVAVISGIGTREYYKKLKYRLKGTYMIKSL